MQPSLSPQLTPRIVVDQPVALYDAPLSIALEGFAPRTRVTVTATFQVAEATPWRSGAAFIADDGGRVDVTRQAPVAGTWEGVSPMGLFWSATPVPGKWRPAPRDWVMWSSVARLHAEAPGAAPAELTVERRLAGAGVSRLLVHEAGVVGTLFLPPGDGPHRAVIVLGGSDGGISEHRAALVASHGYAALSLAYFGTTDLPSELVNVPVEYFERAVSWMRGQPWLQNGFLAVWGASRGGELALLLGATIPAINAVIAYVASGVLHGPFEPHDPPDTPPCWTSRGQPLPYLQEQNATDDPTSVDYTKSPVAESPRYLSQLRDVNAVERATIPVERTHGPILLVSGQDDQIWPVDSGRDRNSTPTAARSYLPVPPSELQRRRARDLHSVQSHDSDRVQASQRRALHWGRLAARQLGGGGRCVAPCSGLSRRERGVPSVSRPTLRYAH